MIRKPSPEIIEEYTRALAAASVVHEDGDMVYHPMLAHLNTNGFYNDPQDCAEALRALPELPKRFRTYCFATSRECCQSLDVDNVIESASQDMFEDWYERVTKDCSEEIKMAQASLDALHKRFMDFPTFRPDYTRVHILPVVLPNN